ncbi:hypothetical protein SDC9_158582 [bioreactor metagenome]|uniref:Uncharacterized protein n=1 Tax=bioreactor metagenome TaxID=1076179 RepID=A0A645FAE5_9ZZZZ
MTELTLDQLNALLSTAVTPSGMMKSPVLPQGYCTSAVPSALYATPSTSLKCVFASSTKISVSEEQSENAAAPKVVTFLGIVTDVSPVSKKEYSSIVISSSGKVIEVSEEQPLNAPLPIKVRSSGRSMVVRPVQEVKAPSPIEVTVSGIVMLFRPVQPWNVPGLIVVS